MSNRGETSRRSRAAAAPFIWAIRAYQHTLAHLIGGRCRFHPSCSHYAIDAYRLHGPIRGTRLTITRLLRCHPWGGSGIDPVPGSDSDDSAHATLESGFLGTPDDPPTES